VSVHGFVKWQSLRFNLNRPSLGMCVRIPKRVGDWRFGGPEDRILLQDETAKSDFLTRVELYLGSS
jgi:hypothetical protein